MEIPGRFPESCRSGFQGEDVSVAVDDIRTTLPTGSHYDIMEDEGLVAVSFRSTTHVLFAYTRVMLLI
jgi:hypothetical protein